MEPFIKKGNITGESYLIAGLFLLFSGLLFGLTGSLQYIIPGFLKSYLSFEKVRPLHVSSVVFWILSGATGSVFVYLEQHTKREASTGFIKTQFYLFFASVVVILGSYMIGIFGGREYWEFNPVLAVPLMAVCLLFLVHVVKSIRSLRQQPVYVWMWLTGAIFLLFTFIESNLWVFPYFSRNVVNDMTIQWKSYGSMVGAWNMLIYGSSIFLMDKISGSDTSSHSKTAFLLFFTGLFNLMFNWGHHIYTLPTHGYIKHISYAVSMTELFILGRIIYNWSATVNKSKRYFHHLSFRFLLAADVWVFLTLLLAILMSVPGINRYTHGTHITVAHTMGATIGINTFILLAIAADILTSNCRFSVPQRKFINRGFWLTNISLLLFWCSLMVAGILKAKWQMSNHNIPFSSMMLQLKPWFFAFFISGVMLLSGFSLIIFPVLKNIFSCYSKREKNITFHEFSHYSSTKTIPVQ